MDGKSGGPRSKAPRQTGERRRWSRLRRTPTEQQGDGAADVDPATEPLGPTPIAVGEPAPRFVLGQAGGGRRSLQEFTARGPALLVFFKTTCKSSQIALSVYGEIERRYGDVVPVVAIAQDPLGTALPWLADQWFAGPVLTDNPSYEVSAQYGLEGLPTAVLVGRDGVVLEMLTGWSRDAINSLASRLGRMTARDEGAVSVPDDGRIAFRPG